MYIKNPAKTQSVEIPTEELYVPLVVDRTTCLEHGALPGEHCHVFESLISDAWIGGICNTRARRAGMTAPIRPASLDRSLAGQSPSSWNSRR